MTSGYARICFEMSGFVRNSLDVLELTWTHSEKTEFAYSLGFDSQRVDIV